MQTERRRSFSQHRALHIEPCTACKGQSDPIKYLMIMLMLMLIRGAYVALTYQIGHEVSNTSLLFCPNQICPIVRAMLGSMYRRRLAMCQPPSCQGIFVDKSCNGYFRCYYYKERYLFSVRSHRNIWAIKCTYVW